MSSVEYDTRMYHAHLNEPDPDALFECPECKQEVRPDELREITVWEGEWATYRVCAQCASEEE